MLLLIYNQYCYREGSIVVFIKLKGSIWNVGTQNIGTQKMQESCELKHGKLQNFKTQEWKI